VSGLPCPERNFVTVGPIDFKLGMHVSGNDLKCSAQEPLLQLVPFFNYSLHSYTSYSMYMYTA